MQLRDRHVVVTGAAGGIGAALADRFHRAGARLTVTDLDGADVTAARLEGARSLRADMRSETAIVDMIDAAEAHHGPVDLYFANAGVAVGTDPMDDELAWETSFDVNVHAHRWAARRLVPAWLDRGEGYFCSTASAAGLLAAIGSAPYSVTKHAAVAFAEWMSITYGERGIRVSCLCPQGVDTAMLDAGDGFGAGANVVRAVAPVLEPAEVADVAHDAIVAERFLVLPHPEVADYLQVKASDPERWLGGMRKLQQRFHGI